LLTVANGFSIDPLPVVSFPPSAAVATNTPLALVTQPPAEGAASGMHASAASASRAPSPVPPSPASLSFSTVVAIASATSGSVA
jgi:hypothetical protein